jgi:hypothetical protein
LTSYEWSQGWALVNTIEISWKLLYLPILWKKRRNMVSMTRSWHIELHLVHV